MQQIIYVLSVLYLFITFFLIKKSKEKISFIKYSFISITTFLCYNAFLCYIFNLINIAVVNTAIAGIITYIIVRQKEIQQYRFSKKNILAFVIIVIVGITITFINYGLDINIKYITTDAAVHFSMARYLFQESEMPDALFQTGSYTNTGIIFKIVSPITGFINLSKIFILFDTFTFILMGLALYCAIEKLIKNKFDFILSITVTIMFMLGYPLNSFIFGYVYLQLGVVIIATIINILQYYSEDFDKKFIYISLFFLNFGIFFTYCIFLPIIYIVEFIYIMLKRYRETKKIISVKNIAIILTIFVIPIICGLCQFVLPHLIRAGTGDIPAFYSIEGYIYRNCWSNFILLLPVALICIKKKNDDTFIWLIFTSILVILMIIYFILIRELNISTYYYYKFNYVLWFMLWYGVIYTLNTSEGKWKTYANSYILIYAVLAIIWTYMSYVNISKEVFNANENITNAFDIYGINKTIIWDLAEDYTPKEMELLEYVNNNIDLKNSNMLLIVDPRQETWFDGFFNYKNREDLQSTIPLKDIDKWNNKEFKYLFILYRSFYYDKYKDKINYGELIAENEAGAIYINN